MAVGLTGIMYAAATLHALLARLIISMANLRIEFNYFIRWIIFYKFASVHIRFRELKGKNHCARSLQYLRIQHADVSHMVIESDRVFSLLTFIWHGLFMVGIYGVITELLQFDSKTGHVKMTRFFYNCVLMIIFFCVFLFVCGRVPGQWNVSQRAGRSVAADTGPSRFLRAGVSVRFPDCRKGRDPQNCKVL